MIFEKNNAKKIFREKGFSLIELIVAMFILLMVMGAMTAVSVSIFRSYQKSRAIKTVTENAGFALNSMAKDIRMGKIENTDSTCRGAGINTRISCLLIARNTTKEVSGQTYVEKACYKIDTSAGGSYAGVKSVWVEESLVDSSYTTCDSVPGAFRKFIDLAGTNMAFHSSSGFYSLPTSATSRGWAEINLNIENPSMETDSIRMQTIVSSRDYNWKETQ